MDPGLANTGWGIIDSDGRHSRHLSSGIIHTSPSAAHVMRLGDIRNELKEVIQQWSPKIACIERVFVNKNAKSSMVLGEARGVAIGVLLECDLEVTEISALQIKKSVTGMGRANKKQVSEMVMRLLALPVPAPADAADALACALALMPLARLQNTRLPAIRSRRRRTRR
ncbi:crossover junction endodeoxyribonuclease RuvC [Candidatus Persebacteraceae bacterium Df01]|uniref:Crossover junction endodeoxyribonuclease RuvC n=1 Tax=Candidatus Doriopsillibacter californiensis TaxID=2970740 RepID=A0ABT7QNN0_9GAMM|nr:crossover junction endodeoxyribonuclease RuvC [Candidatus Persebacteraceae bacterium Df01]